MKKFAVILLLLLYGSSSIGMTLHFHYCCGKLKRIDLSAAPAVACSMDKKVPAASSTPCCDHKQLTFQIKSDQNLGGVVYMPEQQPVLTLHQIITLTAQPLAGKHLVPEVFAPPPLQPSLLHLYCTYRI